MSIRYFQGSERPSLSLWLLDDDGSLIDFSSGYSFVLRVGLPGSSAVLEKSTGITGAAGAGSEPSGTPNVEVAWEAGELDIAPGLYEWQLFATTIGLNRTFSGSFRVAAIIAAP